MTADSLKIRPSTRDDLSAVYEICLQTGDAGKDATALYKDTHLIGHIYAAPYVALEEGISLVAEDEEGILGYAVGAADTRAFEQRMEESWWPDLRQRYPVPEGNRANWSPDECLSWVIHHPQPVPDAVVATCPSHIHMNLLPRARGRGIGSDLLSAWLDSARNMGVTRVHAGVSGVNQAGLKFWTSRGFMAFWDDRSRGANGTIWCSLSL